MIDFSRPIVGTDLYLQSKTFYTSKEIEDSGAPENFNCVAGEGRGDVSV